MVDYRTDDVTSLRRRVEVVATVHGVAVGDPPGLDGAVGVGPQINVRRVAVRLIVVEHDNTADGRVLLCLDDDLAALNKGRIHRIGRHRLDTQVQHVTKRVRTDTSEHSTDKCDDGEVPDEPAKLGHHGVAPVVLDWLGDGEVDADGESVADALEVLGPSLGVGCDGVGWVGGVIGNACEAETRTTIVVVLVMFAPTFGAPMNIAVAAMPIEAIRPATIVRPDIRFLLRELG